MQSIPPDTPAWISGKSTNRQQALLEEARRAATFNVALLTNMIYGSNEAAREHEYIRTQAERELGEDDASKLPRALHGVDRYDHYQEGLRWGRKYLEDTIRHPHPDFSAFTYKYGIFSISPYGHQFGLFEPALRLLADDRQYSLWWPLVRDGKIICTYAQTELGHGTFLRGLETTATLDEHSDEIIIHTPTVTATKYWPGGMGFTASHALVMARLLLRGKDHGIHGFIVQIRSLHDYSPMPGIESGDIGLKMGWNSTDNGYLSFNQVRIPRRNMLMKNTKLSSEGIYLASSNEKLLYGALTASRVTIVHTCAFQLAQAATIATRYSFVREQGCIEPGVETSVMNYKSQHSRLLKHIASAYAILFATRDLQSLYQKHSTALKRGDLSRLAHTHFATSGLKALCTELAAGGAEDCRRCLGGHGYSYLSGLPTIVGDVVPLVTLEGENYVMYQQAARYLIKQAKAAIRGTALPDEVAYLAEPLEPRCHASADFLQPEVQLNAYRHRAARLLFECEEALRLSPESEEIAWNSNMMQLIAAARAHLQLEILQSFISHISTIQDPTLHLVMRKLCTLYALSDIEDPTVSGALGFFEDSYISHSQLRHIRKLVNELHNALLPEAAGLTDAWNFSDASLQSAIGQKDGNAYETLLSWTKQLPMNKATQKYGGVDVSGFENHIRPILGAAKAKL